MNEQDARARRREVGRTLLSLSRALESTFELFNRSKEDPSAKADARDACDEALRALGHSRDALEGLRRSLDEQERVSGPRLSRQSFAR